VLEVSNLTSANGRIQALKGVSLHVARGEVVALVGSNGAGKTTLLRCLSGVQPAQGSIRFMGAEIAQLAAHHRVGGGDGGTRGPQGGVPGADIERSVGVDHRVGRPSRIDLVAQRIAQAAQRCHMHAAVGQLDVGQRGARGIAPL
jgi:branched-chain amino acid transport system ATP-binding protein